MNTSLLLVTSAWLIVLFPAISAVRFDIGVATKDSYSNFIAAVRDQAKDKEKAHGILMLPAPPKPAAFLLLELRASEDISITVALNRSNLYLLGYCDRYQGKERAHFFSDAPENAKSSLFLNAKGSNRKVLNYDTRYKSIETKAKGDVRKIGLGIRKLLNRMEKIFDHEINEEIEAQFLLISVQMISEAARFKYVENQVLQNFEPFQFVPDYKMINLYNEWSTITKAICDSNKDGVFQKPLHLKNPDNKDRVVYKVAEIAPDMGLLNYYRKPTTDLLSRILGYFLVN